MAVSIVHYRLWYIWYFGEPYPEIFNRRFHKTNALNNCENNKDIFIQITKYSETALLEKMKKVIKFFDLDIVVSRDLSLRKWFLVIFIQYFFEFGKLNSNKIIFQFKNYIFSQGKKSKTFSVFPRDKKQRNSSFLIFTWCNIRN